MACLEAGNEMPASKKKSQEPEKKASIIMPSWGLWQGH
jgi:hypothetical protein